MRILLAVTLLTFASFMGSASAGPQRGADADFIEPLNGERGMSFKQMLRMAREFMAREGGGSGAENEVLRTVKTRIKEFLSGAGNGAGARAGFDEETLRSLRTMVRELLEGGRGVDGAGFRDEMGNLRIGGEGGDDDAFLRSMIRVVKGNICNSTDCQEKAITCMEAFKPPLDLLEGGFHQRCNQDLTNVLQQGREAIPAMMTCVIMNVFSDLNLPYEDGNDIQNIKTYLNNIVIPSLNNLGANNGPGDMMLRALDDGTCVLPDREFFKVDRKCLIKTCINNV